MILQVYELVLNELGQTATEYIIMVALLTVVAIVAYIPLSEGILSFSQLPIFSGEKRAKKMVFSQPISCSGGSDQMKGGVRMSTYSAGSNQNSVHGVSWCSGTGDGSNEIGNSLNKLSVKYPEGTDLSDVNAEDVDVKLDKDGDGQYEKDASDDISKINTDGNNLVLTLTGNYNVDKKDSITFAYSGVELPDESDGSVPISINGDAPDAGDETQEASL